MNQSTKDKGSLHTHTHTHTGIYSALSDAGPGYPGKAATRQQKHVVKASDISFL